MDEVGEFPADATPWEIALRITKAARSIGLNAQHEPSQRSASSYVHVLYGASRHLVVRVSDHPVLAYMVAPDFQVGTFDGADGDWQDCMLWIKQRVRKRFERLSEEPDRVLSPHQCGPLPAVPRRSRPRRWWLR
jgi:hypothetical protein